MRVFLAGATGFVGSGILRRLLDDGHKVTALVRDPGRFDAPAGVEVVRGDIGDAGKWAGALKDHDAAINAVGLLRESGENTFQKVVVVGTQNLVDAAERNEVDRFVQVSANGIDSARFPYQTTKLEAEEEVKRSRLAWTILRPSVVFGAEDDFTNQFAKLMRLGAMPYFGDGSYKLAPVAIEDVAAVAVGSLSSDKAARRTFTLCGPEAVTYKQFLKEVKAASGRHAVITYAPKWAGRTMATLLGNMEWFPADRANMEMLFEGNTCEDHSWRDVLGITPKPFRAGIREYLGNGRRDGA